MYLGNSKVNLPFPSFVTVLVYGLFTPFVVSTNVNSKAPSFNAIPSVFFTPETVVVISSASYVFTKSTDCAVTVRPFFVTLVILAVIKPFSSFLETVTVTLYSSLEYVIPALVPVTSLIVYS